MNNKRRSDRNDQNILVSFSGDDFFIFSKLKNLSLEGAFISTHYILDPGTEITLKMEDTNTEKKAKVVRIATIGEDNQDVDDSGLGIEFLP